MIPSIIARKHLATLAVISLAVGTEGCHWLLPYTSPRSDRAGDLLGRFERPRAPDAACNERCTRDSIVKRDLICVPVEAEPDPPTSCPQPPKPANSDGDGLPDSRDPWPATCNRAVFSEPFFKPNWGHPGSTTQPPDSWGRSYGEAEETITCGVVRFIFPGNQTQWVWTQLPAPIQPNAVVEVRILPPKTTWRFTLQAASATLGTGVESPFIPPWDPGDYRSCEVRLANGLVTLQSFARNGAKLLASELVILGNTPPAAVLQSFRGDDQNLHCRLFVGAAYTEATVPLPSLLPSATLVLDAASEDPGVATLDVDYARIFAMP